MPTALGRARSGAAGRAVRALVVLKKRFRGVCEASKEKSKWKPLPAGRAHVACCMVR